MNKGARYIEVIKMNENLFKVVFTRRLSDGSHISNSYPVGRNSYGNRNLPRILEKANHSHYESFKPKGSRIKWTGGTWRKDIPEKTTYALSSQKIAQNFSLEELIV